MKLKTKPVVPRRAYGGLEPDERKLARQKKLIGAGYELFGTIGFNETKIEQVCAEAGVGIRSLYDEFGNLEALFLAVYDDIVDRVFAAISDALDKSEQRTAEAFLYAGIHAYLTEMLEDTRSGRILAIESSRLDAFFAGHRNEALKRFAVQSATRLDAQIPHAVPDLRIWSLMLTGGLNQIVIDEVMDNRASDIDALAKAAAKTWARTLGV